MSLRSISDTVAFYESIFGAGRLSSNGINFDVRCPICAPVDPSKKKLSIRTDSGANHCWVCGWRSRSIVPLVRKYGTQRQMETVRAILGTGGITSQMITGEREKPPLTLPGDFTLLTVAPINDPDVKAAWRYLVSRGLSESDAWYFKFGVSNEPRWKRRIIMPSFDAMGKLNYFTARAIDADRKPKYDNPDVDRNPVVFNEVNLDWTQPIVLCEGPFDLVKCPSNSTAVLGSDLDERHEIFSRILINDTPVLLAFDGDMWRTKTPKVYKKLSQYDVDVKVIDVRPWGDPGAMSKAEFISVMAEAKTMSWEDNFMDRLSSIS